MTLQIRRAVLRTGPMLWGTRTPMRRPLSLPGQVCTWLLRCARPCITHYYAMPRLCPLHAQPARRDADGALRFPPHAPHVRCRVAWPLRDLFNTLPTSRPHHPRLAPYLPAPCLLSAHPTTPSPHSPAPSPRPQDLSDTLHARLTCPWLSPPPAPACSRFPTPAPYCPLNPYPLPFTHPL